VVPRPRWRGEVLHKRAVSVRTYQMNCRGTVGMRHHFKSCCRGKRAHATCFSNTTDSVYIGLQHVNGSVFDQLPKAIAGELMFTRCDGDRASSSKLRIRIDLVGKKRLFDPANW
jgi:hypothetical protein